MPLPFPSPGDPVPVFAARTGGHPAFRFDTTAGRYVVLTFLGTLRNPAMQGALRHIVERHRAWFDDNRAAFFGVSVDPADEREGALVDSMPGIRFFRDFDRSVSRLYGVIDGEGANFRYRPMTLVLDHRLRVLAVIAIDPDGRHNAQFDACVAALPPPPDADAPVLNLPGVFEEDFCRHLIAHFESGGPRSSGVMEHVDGRTTEFIDDRHKKRRDVMVTETGLKEEIGARLLRRLVPGISQAFQFQATRIERYLLACYAAEDGGFFSPHRDNTTPGTAHRRIAVTTNLNEDYDGGDLVFPEFGPRTYRAPVGGAIVFSCSLMHRVLPVARGQRFAFLPFLHDEAAEQVRVANEKFLSDAVINRNVSGETII